jgi:hypothetical protein
MRKCSFALVTTVGLALAALAGPVVAGQVSPADAATEHAQIQNDEKYCPLECYHFAIVGEGVGNRVDMVAATGNGTVFVNTGQSGKWTEIEDTSNGYCLDLTGSASAGYYVNEESCNGRSAELWWVVDGVQGETTQIISQYGTTLLGHDACMWATEISSPLDIPNLYVADCASNQPPLQLWEWEDTS